MVYAIDRSICNGCDACSTHAISHDVKAEKNSIDPEYCVSCNLCSSFCERNAIRKEDGSFTPYKGWDKWNMPLIDTRRCTGCSLCIEECPMNALALTGAKEHGDIHTYAYLKSAGRCIGCEKCASRCPIEAIEMIPQLAPDGTENPVNVRPEYLKTTAKALSLKRFMK